MLKKPAAVHIAIGAQKTPDNGMASWLPGLPQSGHTRRSVWETVERFQLLCSADILVPCFINTKEATGKSPEPAGWKACATS
jgi:hypothetical protein